MLEDPIRLRVGESARLSGEGAAVPGRGNSGEAGEVAAEHGGGAEAGGRRDALDVEVGGFEEALRVGDALADQPLRRGRAGEPYEVAGEGAVRFRTAGPGR